MIPKLETPYTPKKKKKIEDWMVIRPLPKPLTRSYSLIDKLREDSRRNPSPPPMSIPFEKLQSLHSQFATEERSRKNEPLHEYGIEGPKTAEIGVGYDLESYQNSDESS